MTVDEFLVWQERQEERYELVDGYPQLHRMMTGASNFHDSVVANTIGLLWNQLRGTRCRVVTADTAVRTSITGLRRPDVTVDCAPPQDGSYEAHRPTLAVEVFSPSTRKMDQVRKLEEYKRLPSLVYILFAEPDAPEVLLLTRSDEGWTDKAFVGRDAVVELPAIGARLPLADMYEGIPPSASA
jgi:Uma2 family endonuclease